MSANETPVLPNCCENWILQWGRFYKGSEEFMCVPGGHKWKKTLADHFIELSTKQIYILADDQGFLFLKPKEGPEPKLARCCNLILLEHGNTAPDKFSFACPRCKTQWLIGRDAILTLIPVFTNIGTGERYKIEIPNKVGCVPYLYSDTSMVVSGHR